MVIGLLVVAAVAIVSVGVAGALNGPREFHEEEEEEGTEAEAEGALGLPAAVSAPVAEVAR